MSLPALLLVDDSEAVLAFERAALGEHYAIATARDGQAALAQVRAARPDAIVLDLSMPVLPGDEVLARLRADPATAAIPVVVVSSERARGEACLRAGAQAFLQKPVGAEALREEVARVLLAARQAERRGSLQVLFLAAGPLELGVPLERVRAVFYLPATQPLLLGPPYLARFLELHGRPVPLLDLAARLKVAPASALLDRKVVVVEREGLWLGLLADQVRDPEEVAEADLVPRERLAGAGAPALQRALLALARSGGAHLPVVEPHALLSPALRRYLARAPSGGEAAR